MSDDITTQPAAPAVDEVEKIDNERPEHAARLVVSNWMRRAGWILFRPHQRAVGLRRLSRAASEMARQADVEALAEKSENGEARKMLTWPVHQKPAA